MKLDSLPINWFDLLVLVVLVVGGVLGRKKGMSEELLPLFQWLTIVLISGLYYEPIGRLLAGYTQLSLLWAYLITYLSLAVLIKLFFGWLKRMVGEKLVAGDVFGKMEFYLGIMAGTLRFACMLLVAMALLHAPLVSPEELAAQRKMQRDNFGTISFPTFGLAQQAMFDESVTGQFVKKYLNEQLIASTSSSQRLQSREGLGRRRERTVDEALGVRN
jgi:uncharacterized membrane protein required for colicin V production